MSLFYQNTLQEESTFCLTDSVCSTEPGSSNAKCKQMKCKHNFLTFFLTFNKKQPLENLTCSILHHLKKCRNVVVVGLMWSSVKMSLTSLILCDGSKPANFWLEIYLLPSSCKTATCHKSVHKISLF